jgi:hypothetical protein
VKDVYFLPSSSAAADGVVDGSDLTILRLNQTVEFSEDVHPICLPSCEQTDAIALRDGSFGEVRGRLSYRLPA